MGTVLFKLSRNPNYALEGAKCVVKFERHLHKVEKGIAECGCWFIFCFIVNPDLSQSANGI